MNERPQEHLIVPVLDRVPVALAVILAAVAIGKGFLTQSLWLDETITYWLTSSSVSEVIERAIRYQGQSPLYYLLVWVFRAVMGSSEVMLRLPSLIALAGAAALLYKIVRHLFGTEAAGYSLLIFVSHDGFLRAMNARPYALALCCALLSLWAFVRWMEVRGVFWWCLYVFSAAATIYSHYLFGLVLALHLLCWYLRPDRPPFTAAALAAAAIGVLVLPCVSQILGLAGRADVLVFSSRPHLSTLISALLPRAQLVALLCGVLLATVFFHKKKGRELRFSALFLQPSWKIRLAWSWYLLAPPLFFLLAVLGRKYWFVERYFLWQAGGFAALAALVICSFSPRQARSLLVTVLFAMLLLHEADRRWAVEDWRGAVQQIGERETPVLFYSGLIEAEQPNDYGRDFDYLTAPLGVYSLANRVLLLPGALSRQERYFEERIRPALESAGRCFVLYMNRTTPRADEAGSVTVEREFQTFFKKHGYIFTPGKDKALVKVGTLAVAPTT